MGMVAGIILLICGVVGGIVGAVLGLVVGRVELTGRTKKHLVCPACREQFLNHSPDGWPQCPHCQSFYRKKHISGWKLGLMAGCIGGIGYGYFFHVVELFNNVNGSG